MQPPSSPTRRDFVKATTAAALGAGSLSAQTRRSATDWVTLGNSGVRVTRLALGNGTFNGRIQRELGQDGFTRLVRHAYDRGIRFFESSDTYPGMPKMLAEALRGIPRDTYRLMTKCAIRNLADTSAAIDRLRADMNTEYLDILLIHCLRSPDWREETKAIQDGMSEAKQKKLLVAHGASVHGLQALRNFPGYKWLDVAMIRMNHSGKNMDTELLRDSNTPGDIEEVVAHTRRVHEQGIGVISMKLIGEGSYTEAADREAAMRFVMGQGTVDAVTIGFKSAEEVDESIDRMNRALNA